MLFPFDVSVEKKVYFWQKFKSRTWVWKENASTSMSGGRISLMLHGLGPSRQTNLKHYAHCVIELLTFPIWASQPWSHMRRETTFAHQLKSETRTEIEWLTVPQPPSHASTSQTPLHPSISAFVGKNDVLRSEILWTLHSHKPHVLLFKWECYITVKDYVSRQSDCI